MGLKDPIIIAYAAAWVMATIIIGIILRFNARPSGNWFVELSFAVYNLVLLVLAFASDDALVGWMATFMFVFFMWMFFKKLPPSKRKRALKLIGAKARAIRDKMGAAMPQPKALSATA